MSDVSAIDSKLVSIYHVEQEEGLKSALAFYNSNGAAASVLMANVVRHLERSGYPSVVLSAIACLRAMLTDEQCKKEFDKWYGVKRLIGAIDHKTAEVKIATLVLLAQLAKNVAYHDDIALSRGYHTLVKLLEYEDERVQLAASVALRVLVGAVDSNISDFARANGFAVLFRIIRGQTKVGTKVLSSALALLRATASNRTVAIEIKSAAFEMDVAAHLNNDSEDIQIKALEALEAILSDDAGKQFCIKNGKLIATLLAYIDLGRSQAEHAKRLTTLLK